MIDAETQAKILASYLSERLSVRKIARDLNVSRPTVKAVIARRAIRLERSKGQRASVLDPYKEAVCKLLTDEPRIPASTILQRIREQGYAGGYTILRQWVSFKRSEFVPKQKEAFMKLHFACGECAQVDWGEFGDVFKDGIKIHCFVMVLCYSRLIYVEFTRSEKFEDFIRCHEHALGYFGGAPKEIWYDNLATAVTERMGSVVKFNERFWTYIGHHGVRPLACNVARGNEKGRVEDGVKLVRSSFWPGRKFTDFHDLCRQARKWLDDTANRREHRATRKIPYLVFQHEEKATLLPLNPTPFNADEVFTKKVPPDFRITYQTNHYSVPWTLVGQVVTTRIDDENVRVFYGDKPVASHKRCYQKHQDLLNPTHQQGLLEQKPGAKSRQTWQVDMLKSIGPALSEYLQNLQSSPRSLRHELGKLLALYTVYGAEQLNDVIAGCLRGGVIGVDNVEIILKNRGVKKTQPAPLTFKDEKLSRRHPRADLRRYDAFLFESSITPDSEDDDSENDKDTPDD